MDARELFPAAGIRFISVAHEQAAAHAADGLARVTGRPQACIAQNGPGAAHFVSANLRENPDYAQLAEEMGARGFKVEDPAEVAEVFREAVASNKPCVINAIIQGEEAALAEPFRRDALQMPVCYLKKYAHLNAGK